MANDTLSNAQIYEELKEQLQSAWLNMKHEKDIMPSPDPENGYSYTPLSEIKPYISALSDVAHLSSDFSIARVKNFNPVYAERKSSINSGYGPYPTPIFREDGTILSVEDSVDVISNFEQQTETFYDNHADAISVNEHIVENEKSFDYGRRDLLTEYCYYYGINKPNPIENLGNTIENLNENAQILE